MQAGAILVATVGIGVALLNQRRQMNSQMFIEFSRRFADLLRLFPTDAWLANRDPRQELPPSSKELTDCTLYCIQFISDVYYLHKGGYITNSLWRVWEREINRTLRGRLFKREWAAVESEFCHDRAFLHYINSLIGGKG